MALTTVPIHLVKLRDGGFHLFVDIVAFGDNRWVVVDTGASRSVFDKSFIQRHSNDDRFAHNKAYTEEIIVIPQLQIGKIKIKDYTPLILDLKHVNSVYKKLRYPSIVAIIGSDLLYNYNAIVNYKRL